MVVDNNKLRLNTNLKNCPMKSPLTNIFHK